MRSSTTMRSLTPAILLLPGAWAATSNTTLASNKRGIVYVAPNVASDNDNWTQSGTDLSWYYNYGTTPTAAFANSKMEFVPMQWGAPSGDPKTDMSFYNAVKSQISGGANITHVLGFNEPDGCTGGGSCLTAATAAQVWKKQFEPLKKDFGLKLGAPAVTGATTGFNWLQNWQIECGKLSSDGSGCIVDFIPIHWYGNFEGLASHMGQVNGTYSNNVSEIWVTEYAYADQNLANAQDFYNTTADYFDRLDGVGRYSYFGAFRSSVSNVGPYTSMLNQAGKLTDIGCWYLGKQAQGNNPDGTSTVASTSSSSSSSSSGSSSSGSAYKSGAASMAKVAGYSFLLTLATAWGLQ